MYQILPWIEQKNLWKLNTGSGTLTADNVRAGTGVAMFSCPSRGPIRIIVPYSGMWPTAMSDYAANAGTDNTYDPACTNSDGGRWGSYGDGGDAPITHQHASAPFRTVTPATIRRGQAVTLLLGEKCLNRDLLWTGRCDDDSGWVSGWDADINRWGYNVANGDPAVPDARLPHAKGRPHGGYGQRRKLLRQVRFVAPERLQFRHVRRLRAIGQLQRFLAGVRPPVVAGS